MTSAKTVFAVLAWVSLSVGFGMLLVLLWMKDAYMGALATIVFGALCSIARDAT